MQVLVAAFSRDGRHGGHPEMIGESSDDVQSLLKRQLYFEAQTIEFDDFDRRQIQIC